MNFRGFLNNYVQLGMESKRSWGANTRIFAVVRGNEAVRRYVSKMIEEGLGNPSKDVLFLSEVYESLWQYYSYSPHPLRILFWEKGLLDKESADTFLDSITKIKNRRNIIFDSSDELYELVREEFKGKYQVRFIDCRLPRDSKTKKEVYEHWFQEVERINISPKMIQYLSDIPYLESFNLMDAFKLVGEKDFNLLSVKKWGFVWSDKEQFIVDTLLYKGRMAALKENLVDLDSSRFLTMLFREVDALLKIKTLTHGYPQEKAEKAGLSVGKFFALKHRAEKLNTRDLYKWLYIVVNLMKWRHFPGVVNLLFMYW